MATFCQFHYYTACNCLQVPDALEWDPSIAVDTFSSNAAFSDLSFGGPTNSTVEPPVGLAANRSSLSLPYVDSAVDFATFFKDPSAWGPTPAPGPDITEMQHFPNLSYSAQASGAPSPTTEVSFGQENTTWGQASFPETPDGPAGHQYLADTVTTHVQGASEAPLVLFVADKTKTRAETQIKVTLVLDPVDDRFKHIHFPPTTIAKPKFLASAGERQEIEARGESIHMEPYLVCASVMKTPEGQHRALLRARGEGAIPRRKPGVAISDMEKDDPAHPQNGGPVLICEGCKERERKRYERKKKKAGDEEEWYRYEDDRIIMINEKEYKRWESTDLNLPGRPLSRRAKQVQFAMRIACYCRHQEEKPPGGYCIILVFKDARGKLIAQYTSQVFQITDDHKTKEGLPGATMRPSDYPVYQF